MVISSGEMANAVIKEKLKEKTDNLKDKAKELKTKIKDGVSRGGGSFSEGGAVIHTISISSNKS
jgi:hypothetical protein